MSKLPDNFSIDVFDKELTDLADRAEAFLKQLRELCNNSDAQDVEDAEDDDVQIIVHIKPCISRDKLQWLKEEIGDMAEGGYKDIIKSVEVVA